MTPIVRAIAGKKAGAIIMRVLPERFKNSPQRPLFGLNFIPKIKVLLEVFQSLNDILVKICIFNHFYHRKNQELQKI